jgi:AmiR/NasT family two-component response regulator
MKPGIRRLIDDLRGARVLVIHPRDADGDALIDQLKRIGCNVRGMWPPPAELPGDVDTIFHLVAAEDAPDYLVSASDDGPTLLAIVDYENPTVLKRLLDCNAHGVVNKPIRSFGILSSLILARSMHGYTRRLENKVVKLEETLKARRDVEKAVKILVSLRQIGETEAYELIRQQATQKRMSMSVIAATIIEAQDVLGGLGLMAGPRR